MSCCDTNELLSSWSIPKLCSNSLIAIWEWYSFKFELNPVRNFRFLLKSTLCDSKHKVCFTNLFISNYNKLIEVIKAHIWIVNYFTRLVPTHLRLFWLILPYSKCFPTRALSIQFWLATFVFLVLIFVALKWANFNHLILTIIFIICFLEAVNFILLFTFCGIRISIYYL